MPNTVQMDGAGNVLVDSFGDVLVQNQSITQADSCGPCRCALFDNLRCPPGWNYSLGAALFSQPGHCCDTGVLAVGCATGYCSWVYGSDFCESIPSVSCGPLLNLTITYDQNTGNVLDVTLVLSGNGIIGTGVDMQWSANPSQLAAFSCGQPITLSNLIIFSGCTTAPATVTLTPVASGDWPCPCSPLAMNCDFQITLSGIAGDIPGSAPCMGTDGVNLHCTDYNGTYLLRRSPAYSQCTWTSGENSCAPPGSLTTLRIQTVYIGTDFGTTMTLPAADCQSVGVQIDLIGYGWSATATIPAPTVQATSYLLALSYSAAQCGLSGGALTALITPTV